MSNRPAEASTPSRLSHSELVTALAHFYRAEMGRTVRWRLRLDTTTNWAIVSTLGILAFAFNRPEYSQETLIAGMLANLVFLLLEARRFRFFDVWRARLRMIEEHFYVPILRGEALEVHEGWGPSVAEDLMRPRFKISLMQALRARLLRNYVFVFIFLFLAWLGRAFVLIPAGDAGLLDRFRLGGLPGWVPITLVGLLHAGLLAVVLFTPRVEPPETSYWPEPEHAGKAVDSLDV